MNVDYNIEVAAMKMETICNLKMDHNNCFKNNNKNSQLIRP